MKCLFVFVLVGVFFCGVVEVEVGVVVVWVMVDVGCV
jgi:hypothetical protein